MKKCLYVGNLPRTATEEEVRTLFGRGGQTVEQVTIAMDKRTGRSRGFGFVEMATEEDAAAALVAVKGAELDGRELKLGTAFRDKNETVERASGADAYDIPATQRPRGRGRGKR